MAARARPVHALATVLRQLPGHAPVRSLVTVSRQLAGAVSPVAPESKYRIAIVGGGSGGVSVASQLLRKLGRDAGAQIAVIEPSEWHLYQPLWTMVGGLGLDVKQSRRPMEMMLPPGVQWIKERCEAFHPERNCVTLAGGKEVGYDVLIVAAGLKQNFGKVRGLQETLGQNGVASIYSYEFSPAVWRSIEALRQGAAIFTNPGTAVNCGGAPQKIAYLAEDRWRRLGVRSNISVDFFSATAGIFGCPHYREALEKLMASKGMKWHVKSNLIEVDGPAQLATFERDDGEIFTKKFDFLHVTPPMSAPTFVQHSPLANSAGFVDVDKETCQHPKYPNVFALGDCSSLPTSKTYSAISGEAPVVVHNVLQVLKGAEATGAYDGYTACPILTGGSKLMLAEFNGYTMEPAPTFWPLDQRRPLWPFYLMKRFVFEQAYWHLVPLGRWFGKRTIFEPTVPEKKAEPEAPATTAAVPPPVHFALKADLPVSGGGEGHSAESDASGPREVIPHTFGVETPEIPGDVSLCGTLPADIVAQLAPRYKAWLYLNPSDHPGFCAEEVQAAGCTLANLHMPGGLSGGVPTAEHAEALLATISRLPRPLMLQCTSGNRSGAALLLWVAKMHGQNAESARQLAQDMDLKFFTQCTACGPVWDWVVDQLGGQASEPVGREGFMLQQLFDTQGSATFTYAVGCAAAREAVLVDPVLGMEERDLALLEERGYSLKYVVNTHCHADHITSGSAMKRLRPGVKTVISKASGAAADIHIEEGDKIEFGRYHLEPLATPGHTSGCMTFVLRGPGEPRAAFTGDTLLIRGCGRTDFQQGDSEQLYDMVHGKIFTLPGETKVYPGHDYKGRNMSTVEEERTFNPRLTRGKAEFVTIMSELNLPYPRLIDSALPANLADGAQR